MPSHETKKLIEDDSPLINITLSKDFYPYAVWALIISILGRAILILISLKKLSICKVYFHYNMLEVIIVMGLPTGDSLESLPWIFMAN